MLFSCGYPVSPALFTEKTSLSPCVFPGFLVKDKLTIYAWVYFWDFYSVPLVYMSVFMSVPYCFKSIVIYFEIRKCDASSSVPHALSCFCYLGSFVVP